VGFLLFQENVRGTVSNSAIANYVGHMFSCKIHMVEKYFVIQVEVFWVVVYYHNTRRRHNSGDLDLNLHRRENFKSLIFSK